MPQIKIYGLREQLRPIMAAASDVIHSCFVDALKYPAEKRFHRFFPLEADEFIFPAGRSNRYTIIEINMIKGRSGEAKRNLIRQLFERFQTVLGITGDDLEITIIEIRKANWGFRGKPGDEHELNYKIDV